MDVKFACDIWGLRSTDIMQGVVYGTSIDVMVGNPKLRTRLDFDESFGTAINRFVCQAIIGHPLTVYGDIGGQTRGYLPLHDSMQCLTLAIENPPNRGEYRVFNQFEQTYSIIELARRVSFAGNFHDKAVRIAFTEPPRIEALEHYYNPDSKHLLDLGYQPDHEMDRNLKLMFDDLIPYEQRIRDHRDVLIPSIRWDGSHQKVGYTGGLYFGSSSGKSKMPIEWDDEKGSEK
jgi:UDP-sulfoquinovose synthase